MLADRRLRGDDESATVRVLVLVDDAPAKPVVYQVPVVERVLAGASPATSVIGRGDAGTILIDGPHDLAYTHALLAELGLDAGDFPTDVLAGEQSNTSIICRSPSAPPFAFAQEFLPDVEDAWRVALRAASAHADFTSGADTLGRATAEVHRDLARLFPTVPADAAARTTLAGAWIRRLAIAFDEVPALQPQRRAIEDIYAAAAGEVWPALQRVHGDYHLGQVISVPGRGWVVLDFEGEPMRPIEERRAPDLALRDIAGMLRSFDYVAGTLRLARTGCRYR